MDKEQIEQLKKTRETLSCNLSTLRREIKNSNLNNIQIKKKIERGIKASTKFQEISNQLISEGCKFNTKAPYLDPDWWRNYDSTNTEIPQAVAPVGTWEVPVDEMQTAHIMKEPAPIFTNLETIIKDAIKTALNEQEYILNIAWTEGIGDDNDRAYLLSIISDYLHNLNIKLENQESMGKERIYKYRYCGSECDIIKKTLQFFIDKWGSDTDVAFFCKKYVF